MFIVCPVILKIFKCINPFYLTETPKKVEINAHSLQRERYREVNYNPGCTSEKSHDITTAWLAWIQLHTALWKLVLAIVMKLSAGTAVKHTGNKESNSPCKLPKSSISGGSYTQIPSQLLQFFSSSYLYT